jgi:hypothetical protein
VYFCRAVAERGFSVADRRQTGTVCVYFRQKWQLEYEGKEVITTLKTVTLRKVLVVAHNAAGRVQKPSKTSSRIKEGAGSV